MIVLDGNVVAKLPIRRDRTPNAGHRGAATEHRLQDYKSIAEILFERLVITGVLKAPENQGATARHLHRCKARIQLSRGNTVHLLAFRNADGAPFLVVLPMVKSAADRSVAFILNAKGVEAMRAPVFKAVQRIAEALHEHRSTSQSAANPVAIVGDVGGQTKQCPDLRKLRLLSREGLRIGQGSGPAGSNRFVHWNMRQFCPRQFGPIAHHQHYPLPNCCATRPASSWRKLRP